MIATTSFQREKVMDTWDEMFPLLTEHWKEVALFNDIPLDPDKEAYERMEANGAVRLYTLRDEGQLVGYSVFFIIHHPHYKSSMQAQQDIIYITPEARGIGKQFIKDCDEELRKEGVQVVSQHVKASHNFGPLLERIGYVISDHIYVRRLDY